MKVRALHDRIIVQRLKEDEVHAATQKIVTPRGSVLINTPPRPSDTHGFSTQAADRLRTSSVTRALITSDHDTIQRWAARHSAVPATGEATVSGPATVDVNDGGAGIRFNFPRSEEHTSELQSLAY